MNKRFAFVAPALLAAVVASAPAFAATPVKAAPAKAAAATEVKAVPAKATAASTLKVSEQKPMKVVAVKHTTTKRHAKKAKKARKA